MLFIPRLPEEYAVWMGPIRSCEDFKQRYGLAIRLAGGHLMAAITRY